VCQDCGCGGSARVARSRSFSYCQGCAVPTAKSNTPTEMRRTMVQGVYTPTAAVDAAHSLAAPALSRRRSDEPYSGTVQAPRRSLQGGGARCKAAPTCLAHTTLPRTPPPSSCVCAGLCVPPRSARLSNACRQRMRWQGPSRSSRRKRCLFHRPILRPMPTPPTRGISRTARRSSPHLSIAVLDSGELTRSRAVPHERAGGGWRC